MLNYFKTKFPVCCHWRVISGINYIQLPLVTITNRTKINRTMKSLFNYVQKWHNFRVKSEVHGFNINLGTNVNRIICCLKNVFFLHLFIIKLHGNLPEYI